MAVIVAGKLIAKPLRRAEFIERSLAAVALARAHQDCDDFSISADPLDGDRINIFEKWQSRSALTAFRSADAAADNDLFSLISAFDVHEYELAE